MSRLTILLFSTFKHRNLPARKSVSPFPSSTFRLPWRYMPTNHSQSINSRLDLVSHTQQTKIKGLYHNHSKLNNNGLPPHNHPPNNRPRPHQPHRPPGTLPIAAEFYGTTLGLTPRPVPALQKSTLAWFDIGSSGQQVHVAHGVPSDFEIPSKRHPCFKLGSPEALLELRRRVYEHFERGGDSAPKEADKPGEKSSGEVFFSFKC